MAAAGLTTSGLGAWVNSKMSGKMLSRAMGTALLLSVPLILMNAGKQQGGATQQQQQAEKETAVAAAAAAVVAAAPAAAAAAAAVAAAAPGIAGALTVVSTVAPTSPVGKTKGVDTCTDTCTDTGTEADNTAKTTERTERTEASCGRKVTTLGEALENPMDTLGENYNLVMCGFLTGFISGLLGLGGGIVSTT